MITEVKTCELCGAEEKLPKHHLVPQLKCKNKYKNLKNDQANFLWVCEACHRTIHASYTESELRDLYNTKEKLLESDKVGSFVAWRKKHFGVAVSPTKMSNRRKFS